MPKGCVKWFNSSKGYGFIESGSEELFFHFSEIQMDGFKQLQAMDEVEFEKKNSPKGWMAVNIHKVV